MKRILLLTSLLCVGCQQQSDDTDSPIKNTKKSIVQPVAASEQEQDAAPPGLPPTTFQRIKPTHEPYSRYGNRDVYFVDGKQYKVMRSAKGYKAHGIASWYGTKFHNKRTSSGDDYNMYDMTAAHKTLPLPSYVRVKNVENGKEAIVRVNDRGPFHSERVIDLSYAAAVKLGMLAKGTAKVEIEALTFPQTRSANYYVQAAVFDKKNQAVDLKNKLKKINLTPVFVEPFKNRYYVRIGPLKNSFSIEKIKQKLAAMGLHGAFSVLH